MTAESLTNFDSFGVKYILKEIAKFIGNEYITINIYKIQTCDSITNGYICIAFIDFTLRGKSLIEYTNLFFPNQYKKQDKVILKYFQ